MNKHNRTDDEKHGDNEAYDSDSETRHHASQSDALGLRCDSRQPDWTHRFSASRGR